MAKLRFAVGLQRVLPWLGYHHILMLLGVIAIVLLSILLAGCSSYSTMTGIYVLALKYHNSSSYPDVPPNSNLSTILSQTKGDAQLEVRTGYFGLCAKQTGTFWFCSNDAQGLVEQIGIAHDPLNLIWASKKFQNDVIFSGLLFMSIVLAVLCVCGLATFPGWREERDPTTGSDVDVKPFPSRPVSQICLVLVFVSAVLTLIASLWQHTSAVAAAAMADATSYGNIKTGIGTAAIVLAWSGFMLLTVTCAGLFVMILSIIVLDKLAD